MSYNIKTTLCGIDFKNPVITASGTFNFGKEYESFYPLNILGGISTKGLTLQKKLGNEVPRIAESSSGIMNSVGLQNPGVDAFINKELPNLITKGTKIIANLAGSSLDDYVTIADKIDKTAVDMIELNISCPNVKEGGIAFGVDPKSVYTITKAVKDVVKNKPLIIKLTPNVSNIIDNAKAVEDGGGDAISMINTVGGMAVDYKSGRPILANVFGGLSGPAIKPIALKMIWQVYNSVKIPIIGMGGISTFEDVLEFIICGASAIQVGTANLIDPMASANIIKDLDNYLLTNDLDINSLIGSLRI